MKKTSVSQSAVRKSARTTAAKKEKAAEKAAETAPVKKAPAKKPAAKKAPAKETVAKKAPAKKPVVKKAPVQEETVRTPAVAHKKRKLTKAEKKHYAELLMEARHTFMNQLQFHQDDALTSKKDSAGERAGMATHMADLGSDNFRHDIEIALLSEESDVIEMIDESLQRLEDGEFGICMDCGCMISSGRLEAKPYARYCVRCKNKREKQEEPHRRHR